MTIPMKIVAISARDYRSLVDIDWHPGDVNVIIGPSASGKSNFLGLLRMVTESARGKLKEFVYAEGGMGSLLFDGRAKSIDVNVSIGGLDTPELDELKYRFTMKRLGTGPDFVIEEEHEEDIIAEVGRRVGIDRSEQGINLRHATDPDDAGKRVPSSLRMSETVLSSPQIPFLRDNMLVSLQEFIGSWAIYPSFRTDSSSPVRQATVSRRDEVLEWNGENLAAVLHTHYSSDLDFRERIDSAMYAAFGEAYRELTFPPGAAQQIQLAVRWSALRSPAPAADLSDGTLRFLFIIAALSVPRLPPLIAIDEPETGLHPSMMRIIAEYATDAAAQGTQVLFTTHSASFLDAFDKSSPPQTSVATVENGMTGLRPVDSKLLDRWLDDYSLGALYRSNELANLSSALPEAA